MKRKKLIPLLLFLLLLLLILCAWCHSDDIVKKRAISSPQVHSTDVNAITQQDIDFNFVKKENNLELTGNFANEKSIQILHTALGTTDFNDFSNINNKLVAKEGVIGLTQKILLPFNKHYQEGSISYANGELTIEGVVNSEADKNAMATLLANSSIPSKNNTIVKVSTSTEEAKLAALAEEKAKEEAEAKAQAEEEAKLAALAEEKAKEEAKAKAQAEEEAKLAALALEAKIKNILETENITFELNKARLTEKSIDTVSHIATILKENPSINVEIGGHTDSLGDDNYNLNLSQKRVNRVKEKLIQMEINANRIKAVGYGETQPLLPNDTKENRCKNRRVEFKILGE